MDKKRFKKYKFIKAEVTNTRLMGVVGLVIYWEVEHGYKYCQLFHLDAEEYGIDDYDSILDEKEKVINRKKLNMMGGLGGEFVSISEKESRYLVCEFVEKNKAFSSPVPCIEEYEFILNENIHLEKEEIDNLWDKICEKIISLNQIINYFIIRTVGKDYMANRYLSTNDINYKLVNNPSTLLRNEIKNTKAEDSNTYIVESLIDDGDESNYKIVISKIKVEKIDGQLKVTNAEVKETMNISGVEAAFKLNRKEYILVYDIEHENSIIKILDLLKPYAMKNAYELGYLYTEFNPHNRHVDKGTYYLNEDIYGLYYITEEELIVVAHSNKVLEELKNYFAKDKFKEILILKDNIEINQPVLCNFIESNYDNFHDFLNQF